MTSASETTVESILAADVGSTMTRAALIDLVDGEFRILANAEFPTTLEPPWSDVSLSVLQCVSRLEDIADRKLLDERGTLLMPERPDGHGVDAFVVTASAAEPLRVAIAGLTRDFSVESARKATLTTYALPESLVALHEHTANGNQWDLPARIFALHKQLPNVIIVVGGNDKGANAPLMDIVNAVGMACATWPDANKPDVLYAGSGAVREQVARMIGEGARLSAIDNIRPDAQGENLAPLEQELETMYVERRLNRLPGIGKLSGSSSQPIVTTSRAFGAGVRALAKHYGLSALGVDVGSSNTTASVSDQDKFVRVQRSDLGVGHSIESVARQAGIANVLRWLPQVMSAEEAWDLLANKALRPFTLPDSRKELLLEQAAAREAIRLTVRDIMQRWQPKGAPATAAGAVPEQLTGIDLLIGSGGVLTHAPFPGQTVLLLLDAFQPIGLIHLALDSGALLPQLSLIASVQPQAAAQLAAREGIVALGTAICPVGAAKPGDVVLNYKLSYKEGESGTLGGEVHAGEIEVLPLPAGRKGTLELKPARGIDLGQGKGRPAVTTVEGGLVGMIIDARGRPLLLPDDAEKRAASNQQWLYNVGA